MSSPKFYDEYVTYQVKCGINDRIVGLYKRLKRTNINTYTSVLEIGCGIGTLTSLMLRKIKTGRIEAIDISSKSIEFAKQHLYAPNLTMWAGDAMLFQPIAPAFDRVLLFDVLEHIPLQMHTALFKLIRKWMHADGLLLINLPNPAYILFDQINNPSALQEIDQPVYISQLADTLEQANLDIVQMETYSVWVKDDYQYLIVKMRKTFNEELLSGKRNIIEKAVVWMKRKWWKLVYPYPPG